MSEEQRITNAVKEKDPRRVEAGKRLGAISRSAKDKKARQLTEAKPAEEDICEDGYSVIAVITGVGVLSGLVYLYFAYKKDRRAEHETVTEPQSGGDVVSQKPSGSKLLSLDD
jgi:hypothetical protein